MSEHTPGPWRVMRGQTGKLYVVAGPNEQPFRGQVIASETTCPDYEANASLIATAPELLEELDRLAGEVRGCWGMAEQALREILGNTNYHIVEERLESSRVAVGKALGRGEDPAEECPDECAHGGPENCKGCMD